MNESLPRGWLATTVGGVAEVVTGRTPPTAQTELFAGDLPFVKPGDLDQGSHLSTTETGIAEAAFEFVPRLPVGTLLVSCIGNLGKTAVLGREGSCNQQINAVLPTPAAQPEFLLAWARMLRPWLHENSSATTVSIINKGRFLRAPIALPPLNEQRRIVAKLEALQSRSRRAREALDAVPALLEKLRQSILAAAFRGDLTKDWRAKRTNPEPASALLARIRTERRQKWEAAELAKLKAKGKAPTNDSWKAKYKEPEPVDKTGLPELPEGWCWASVDEVTSAARSACYGVIQPGEDLVDGVPLVRVCDLEGEGRNIDIAALRKIPASIDDDYERSRLQGGELLVSVVGTIGRTAIAPVALKGANIARAVARLVFEESQLAEWTMYWFNSLFMWHRLNLESREVARKTLNVSQLVAAPVPLPPLGEAAEVIARLKSTHVTIERLTGTTVGAARAQSTLERAVLAKAFRGELVPQDPNDEPADAMLARLRTDGPADAPRQRPRRGKATE